MKPVQISDHVDQGLLRLLQQYKGKTRIEGLIESCISGFQAAEDTAFDMYGRTIADSEGDTLENIASYVGIERIVGESDADLRSRIYIQIVRNTSYGTPEAVIATALLVVPDATIQLHEGAVASFSITVLNVTLTDDEVENLYSLINQVKPAGVKFQFLASAPDPAEDYFSMDGPSVSGVGGFGNILDASAGGVWAEVAVES